MLNNLFQLNLEPIASKIHSFLYYTFMLFFCITCYLDIGHYLRFNPVTFEWYQTYKVFLFNFSSISPDDFYINILLFVLIGYFIKKEQKFFLFANIVYFNILICLLIYFCYFVTIFFECFFVFQFRDLFHNLFNFELHGMNPIMSFVTFCYFFTCIFTASQRLFVKKLRMFYSGLYFIFMIWINFDEKWIGFVLILSGIVSYRNRKMMMITKERPNKKTNETIKSDKSFK